MTLPINPNYPIREDQIKAGGDELVLYMRDLVRTISNSYRDSVDNIDGTFTQFTPVVNGATISGDGTYDHQTGWYLRKGIQTHVWFDVEWTAHTGTGDLYLTLPYYVTASDNAPFVGNVVVSGLGFPAGTSYVSLSAEPSSFSLYFIASGSGVTAANLQIAAFGAVKGYIFYMGEEGQ